MMRWIGEFDDSESDDDAGDRIPGVTGVPGEPVETSPSPPEAVLP